MKLKHKQNPLTHISHFHSLVSAYETNEDTVKWLEETIIEALQIAKEKMESQIVDQDNTEHIFVCHPSGMISLYRQIANYEIGD